MAVILATGRIWLRVPETLKIEINGQLPPGLSAKDIALFIIGELGADGALYQSVWFTGPAVSALSISERLVLTNMAVEMGAKNGYMEVDEKTLGFLNSRARGSFDVVASDADARPDRTVLFDIGDLEPQVACPHAVDNVVPVSAVAGVKIDQVFFGSCTNARLQDFAVFASAVRGKKVHPGVRLIVIPASNEVFAQAMSAGFIQDLAAAGAVIGNSNCGPCMGSHQGVPAPGEVVLSTSNRNFRGRFGCPQADIYLASPLTAAVSALRGEITDFRSESAIGGRP
jgi:3-isopropylmalate/(R)-2-methylmalate dehydratase large subunit